MPEASNRGEPRSDVGESAPRRVGEVRQEREAEREAQVHRRDQDGRGKSWVSVVFGCLASLGSSLIPSGIGGGIIA